jgi:mannitol/fructose-specific phosphotransferase system IIA component (Ntr-type)
MPGSQQTGPDLERRYTRSGGSLLDTLLFTNLESQDTTDPSLLSRSVMRLSQYLRDDLVVHGLEASDRSEALEALGGFFERSAHVPAGDSIVDALRKREEEHTTVLGEGVAVPHATIPNLPDVLLLVAKASSPVPFGPPDTGLVDLFFVLLSPPGRGGEHIKILARICRLVKHPGFLQELRDAADRDEILQAILRVDSQHV